MAEPRYHDLVSAAWQLVWRHPSTWILGLFSVLLGQFGLSNFVGLLLFAAQNPASLREISLALAQLPELLSAQSVVWFVWLMLFVVLIVLFFGFVAIASQGALIASAAYWSSARQALLTASWHKGVRHFWRLLFLQFLSKFSLLALLVIGLAALILTSLPGYGATLLAVVFLTVVGLGAFFVESVTIYASAYIVVDELPLLPALEGAGKLLFQHLFVSGELMVLNMVVNFLFALFIMMLSFWVMVPAVMITLLAGATGWWFLIAWGAMLSVGLFGVLIAGFGGLLNAFLTTSWILAFMQMRHRGLLSRLFHWFRNFKRA